MIVGFDFDNTIVSYDKLFHKVAKEQNLIDDSIAENKLAVRDYLRATDREPVWTEMQGYVYGARMGEAQSYPEALHVMRRIKEAGHTLMIVSHKTKHPYLGKKYDLHQAAREWIENNLLDNGEQLIPSDRIFFELTKDDKWARIKDLACDVYIDDLPEILISPSFPKSTQGYLFDPEKHHANSKYEDIKIVSSWKAFESCLI